MVFDCWVLWYGLIELHIGQVLLKLVIGLLYHIPSGIKVQEASLH